ncbi:hypothetical protein ACFV3R_04830 [Streptomyces sp. NPDC059740]|uniref:hypothetical protein n=1 Tax=Streptomyces sp. NPDC059740 TaxID=3346926 RepID=UPI00366273D6
MAGKEYGVDLDALDEVVRNLNQVLKDMGDTKGKAKNNTYMSPSHLGTGFSERDRLHESHGEMKSYIEDKILAQIEKMIDDFGKKSKKTHEAYTEAEHNNSMK